MDSIAITSLVCLSGIIILIVIARRIMKSRIADNRPLPNPAFFMMRSFLKLRRNPEKIQGILEQAGVKKGMSILDYGCGIGSYAIEAAKLVGESGNVVAADINEKMLQDVQQNMNVDTLSNIHPLLVKAPEDVQENGFDFVFLIDVLHLMKDPLQTIEVMFKKLADKGKLLIKFEHFSKQQRDSLLTRIRCSETKIINNKYWELSKE